MMPPNGSCMDELNGDDDFLPSEFMPFLDDELIQQECEDNSMSWFDIEGLVGTLDTAMDNKLDGLFPMNNGGGNGHLSPHPSQHQHQHVGGVYGQPNHHNHHFSEYPPPSPSPLASPHYPLSRCNSVPVGSSQEFQGRVIRERSSYITGMRGGYMADPLAYPPAPAPAPHPHASSNSTFFRASYEAYHTNNLNQTRSSNRIMAGFDALVDAFKAGKSNIKNNRSGGGKKKSSKADDSNNKKGGGGGGGGGGAKEFLGKLKDAFRPPQQQQKVSPIPPSMLSRSSSLKKKGSGKKPLGSRNTSFKKETNTLSRSYSDGPPLKSRSSSSSGRKYSEFSVEGAIQSLLSGQSSSGLSRTGSFSRQLSREISFFNKVEEEGLLRRSDSSLERLSNDSPVDHFGTSSRQLEQSLQKHKEKWGAFQPGPPTTAKGDSEASYNLQDITKQLFSPVKSKNASAKSMSQKTGSSPLDLKSHKENAGTKVVGRCLSSKW